MPGEVSLAELWREAEQLMKSDALDRAESAARELVLRLEPADPGPPAGDGPSYTRALGLLASIILQRSGPDAADRVLVEALAQPASSAGLRRAEILLNRAGLMEHNRRTSEAQSLALEAAAAAADGARAIDPASLGAVADAASMVIALGGSATPAVEVLQQALANVQARGGAASAMAYSLHQRLARLLLDLSRYADALTHTEVMAAVESARHGADSVEAAEARADHALALDQVGRYTEAEAAYREALRILRRARAEADPSVTRMRFNLAELARIKGDLTGAERQFRALEIEDIARSPDAAGRDPQLQINFGLTLIGLEKFAEARVRLNAALALRAQRPGTTSPQYARVLLALGQLAQAEDNHREAGARFTDAAAILEQWPTWSGTRGHALFESALSRIHGDDPAAAAAEARALIAQARSADSFLMIRKLIAHQLKRVKAAGLTDSLRDELRADVEHADDVGKFVLVELLRSQGERAMRESLHSFRQMQRLHLALVIADTGRTPEQVARAFRIVTRVRAAETTALRLRARRYIQYDPSETRRKIAELKDSLTRLELRLGTAEPAPEILADRDRFLDELADAEFHLASATSLDRLDLEFIGEEGPLLALEPAGALLLVAEHWRFKEKESAYAVFIAGPGAGALQLVDLGAAAAVNDLIQRFRDAVVREGKRARPREEVWREPGIDLARLLIDPLRPFLEGVRQLRVLGDGKIALLPLAALPREAGGYLVEEFDITYDTSLRALGNVMFEEDTGIEGSSEVFGAPAYTSGSEDALRESPAGDFLAQFQAGGRFEPLDQVEAECREIATLLKVEPRLGLDATEAAFRALRSPEVLHVATHGFYLAAGEDQTEAGSAEFLSGRRSLVDSLDRAGLAFAGANDYLDGKPLPQGTDDGILYAAELAGQDFLRTDLVTLSACQTGLGDIPDGDGIHGFQRALLSAGARTVICSLWDVPDEPTRLLFTGFYARVLAGAPRGLAFHETVRELAGKYPGWTVAWGGFVLYGRTDLLARFSVRGLRFASMKWPKSAPPNRARAEALYNRGNIHLFASEWTEAVAAYTEFLALPELSPRHVAMVLVNRSGAYRGAGDVTHMLEDLSAVIGGSATPPDQRAKALILRSEHSLNEGNLTAALADADAVIEGVGAPPEELAGAHLLRGLAHEREGNAEQAYRCYLTAREVEGAPPARVELASSLIARLGREP